MRNKTSTVLFLLIITISICVCLSATAQTSTEPIAITVLNFTNRSASGEWQWLSKGLADMLITDLSQCGQLQVVERERMQALFEEMKLSTTGLIETSTGTQFGKVAKVDKAILGSFLKEGENLEIEAHLIDVATKKLLRVEWVKGKAEDLLKLEKKLSFKIIENIHIPITEAEKESIRYVPTDSIGAVEHFYNGLNHYDRGEYYKAYVEFRSALKKDKGYVEAMLWVGTIYSSLGKYRHAVAEYDELLLHYPKHKLANKILFKLARLYDKKLTLAKPAIESYEKLINEYGDSPHALTSRYRLAKLKEMDASSSLMDVYLSYQAVSKYLVTAFGEGQHNLARIAYEKAKTYYVELFNQFNGAPPPVEGVVVLDPESPTFYRDYASGEGEHRRTGSWGYYSCRKEGYIFRAAEGHVFKEFYVEMTRSPSEKKRSGNLSFVAKIYCREIYLGYYPLSRCLSIDDTDPISMNKVINLEKETNLVQVNVTDLFSALSSWKLTAKFSPSPKVSGIPSLPRKRLGRYIIGNDLGRKTLYSLAGTERGMYNIRLVQDKDGIFRLAYNNVAIGRGSYGQAGTDPDIYITSSDDGEEWSKPVNLPINSMDSDIHPSLIQDRDGMFRLSWLSGRGEGERTDIWISSSRNCHNWAKPRKVDSGLPGPPIRSLYISTQTLFQDLDGEYWIIFENADLYAIHSSDCSNWSKPVNITKTNISGNKKFPVAFQDKQGIYRIAWGPPSSTDYHITTAMSSDGVHWKIEKVEFAVKNKESHMNFLSFMQDKTGLYILLFSLNGHKHSVSNDCRKWSGLREIKERAQWASFLFQDNHGQFWLMPRERVDERCPLLTIINSIE